jgi:hypothetical protein
MLLTIIELLQSLKYMDLIKKKNKKKKKKALALFNSYMTNRTEHNKYKSEMLFLINVQ